MSSKVLVVPGYRGSGDGHWQTWLEGELYDSQRVRGIDWDAPVLFDWAAKIVREIESSAKPVVIVAHSFGCLASALAIERSPRNVAGVLLVAPANPEKFGIYGAVSQHGLRNPGISSHLPANTLRVPGLLIGSQNDPWLKIQHGYAWARRWGLGFHDAGAVGHINVDSGHGPWPLAKLLTQSLCHLAASRRTGTVTKRAAYRRRQHLAPVANTKPAVQRLLYA
ncbi:MAG: RBBP9/YdeN family alpha/beta hydrolase [Haliea sp.]